MKWHQEEDKNTREDKCHIYNHRRIHLQSTKIPIYHQEKEKQPSRKTTDIFKEEIQTAQKYVGKKKSPNLISNLGHVQ